MAQPYRELFAAPGARGFALAEAAFWIAQGEDGDARLAKGLAALDLLLRGLLIKS